jgi:NAD(P) transhydrogenase subunit alpha
MELVPRITRAQTMDALSSQANIAGYKAVMLAAASAPRLFPMLMTAAGTIQPAKVFVIGAGVAGLQAIATARRLGAVISAYDVRPAVKEQVQSVGARFVELPLETSDAQDAGGYARAQSEETLAKQRALMSRSISESDVVISTALIPGRPAPKLVPADAVNQMKLGSVIVDLAAERGGNCELTQPGKVIDHNGVTIIGIENLAATVPLHASQVYSSNLVNLLGVMIDKQGALKLDTADEIIKAVLVCHQGQLVSEMVAGTLASEEVAAAAT